MAVLTGYYIYPGTVSRAQLYADGYEIKDLPAQTDMTNGRLWIRPGNPSDIVRPAAFHTSISGRKKAYGTDVFTWPMVNLSPNMVAYIFTTIFGGDYDADLTVQTFNRATGDWEAYNCIGQFPNVSEQASPVAGGYSDFQIIYVDVSEAPDGPDLAIAVTYPAAWVVGVTMNWVISNNNGGDAATFADIIVSYDLPSGMLFTSTTASGWTVTWSTNGSSYFNFISNPPPQPQTDVRYVRWTYDTNLSAGADTTDISLQTEANSASTIANTFTVTTTGDTDTSDNTITVTETAQGKGFSSGFDSGFGISERGFSVGFEHPPFGITPNAFDSGFSNGFGATPS